MNRDSIRVVKALTLGAFGVTFAAVSLAGGAHSPRPLGDDVLATTRGADRNFFKYSTDNCDSGAATGYKNYTGGTAILASSCDFTNSGQTGTPPILGSTCADCTGEKSLTFGVGSELNPSGTGQWNDEYDCGFLQSGNCSYNFDPTGKPIFSCVGMTPVLGSNGGQVPCGSFPFVRSQAGLPN